MARKNTTPIAQLRLYKWTSDTATPPACELTIQPTKAPGRAWEKFSHICFLDLPPGGMKYYLLINLPVTSPRSEAILLDDIRLTQVSGNDQAD